MEPKKKKPYPGKPQIYFESFQMSTSIAAGCEVRANFSENICGVDVPNVTIPVFSPGINGCALKSGGGYYRTPQGKILCYSNMGDGYNVFNS